MGSSEVECLDEYLIAFRGFVIFGFCMVMMIPISRCLFAISHCVCHGRILVPRVSSDSCEDDLRGTHHCKKNRLRVSNSIGVSLYENSQTTVLPAGQ